MKRPQFFIVATWTHQDITKTKLFGPLRAEQVQPKLDNLRELRWSTTVFRKLRDTDQMHRVTDPKSVLGYAR